jgi:lipopolysaccharide transport system permease protein
VLVTGRPVIDDRGTLRGGVIVRRDLAQRFRGSVLGWVWAVAGPLVLLSAYTVIFSGPIKLSAAADRGIGNYALSIFAGLVVFNLFAELVSRAPSLMRENAWFVKRTMFPSDTIGWIALLRGLAYAGISFALLVIFKLALTGTVPVTVLLVPLVIIPYCLLLLGLVWFFAAMGSFADDVSHIVTALMPLLIFACPVFYTFADIPEAARTYANFNTIGVFIEMMRDLVLRGAVPDLTVYAASSGVALLIFFGGHAIFMRYRTILVDVV